MLTNNFLEARILSADPLELVRIIYDFALGQVWDARQHLAAGRIAERAAAIGKASGAIQELLSSLDRQRGGEFSARLASLYEYLQGLLMEANLTQSDRHLCEAESLLETLASGWRSAVRTEGAVQEDEELSPAPAPYIYGPSDVRTAQAWTA